MYILEDLEDFRPVNGLSERAALTKRSAMKTPTG